MGSNPIGSTMPEGKFLEDVTVLEGLEPVRKRPAMYVGDTSGSPALTALVMEPLCLAIDESTGGPASEVTITLLDDDTVRVTNNGAGLPLGGNRYGTFIENIMTKLHACRDVKHEEAHKKWCGLGVAIVCALSELVIVRTARDGGVWEQRFEHGRITGPIEHKGKGTETWTGITFKFDRTILTGTLDVVAIGQRVREFEADIPCTRVLLQDMRKSNSRESDV